jgi:nucleoside recognition membrane protein YjiH
VKDEYRIIALGIAFLLLSPIILPIISLDVAPLIYAAIGITGLIILSTAVAGILK